MGFKTTGLIEPDGQFHLVTDSFRIVGNPRNEKKYFGKEISNIEHLAPLIESTIREIKLNTPLLKTIKEKALTNNVGFEEQLYKDAIWIVKDNQERGIIMLPEKTQDSLARIAMVGIKSDKKWFKTIEEKALKNKISSEEQLYQDALWLVNENRNKEKKEVNNRWKRNPRVGDYSFLCVVLPTNELKKLPQHIQSIDKRNDKGNFVNPYYYFLYNKEEVNDLIEINLSDNRLITKAKINFASGIYVDELSNNNIKIENDYYSTTCGNNNKFFKTAQVQQFFHNIDKNYLLNTIPILSDVKGEKYSKEEFFLSRGVDDKDRIKDVIQISKRPCETVYYNERDKSIDITTPSSSPQNLRKENVGINTRIGFTYGKYRAKIKFPELINNHNIWNGLTYAFWLIYQDDGEWNSRRICTSGYISKEESGKNVERTKSDTYSEIDIEIVKTSKYWPKTSYIDSTQYKIDDAANNREFMVTCTNWDLACRDSEQFIKGATKFKKEDKEFWLHRWDENYKAITLKTAEKHDNVFKKDYYWYEIDWQPDRIVWRIGEDKENMRIIGYMDSSVTSIPNNQMLMVVTQEYHHSWWWPLAPFQQDDLPFPKSSIIGKIYDLEIE